METRNRFAAAAAAFVLAAAVAPVVTATSASAYPRSCRITTYYATAAMATVVGTRSTCPGQPRHTGRTTPYYETETIELDPPGPPPHGGPGNLPCEFTVPGCSPIPGPHH